VTESPEAVFAATLAETIGVHEQLRAADPRPVLDAAAAIAATMKAGGKLLVFGNGGSAADAQHVAAECVVRFQRERVSLAAIALATDASVLTAASNDLGFDRAFARQIEALGRPGDVALGVSTSGRSPNVLKALETARSYGLKTVALTGCDGGAAGPIADIHINVPSASTPRVQEAHRTLLHVICDLVERAFV
jgi:D-sedoheptulose 7-phosphate isomerase